MKVIQKPPINNSEPSSCSYSPAGHRCRKSCEWSEKLQTQGKRDSWENPQRCAGKWLKIREIALEIPLKLPKFLWKTQTRVCTRAPCGGWCCLGGCCNKTREQPPPCPARVSDSRAPQPHKHIPPAVDATSMGHAELAQMQITHLKHGPCVPSPTPLLTQVPHRKGHG